MSCDHINRLRSHRDSDLTKPAGNVNQKCPQKRVGMDRGRFHGQHPSTLPHPTIRSVWHLPRRELGPCFIAVTCKTRMAILPSCRPGQELTLLCTRSRQSEWDPELLQRLLLFMCTGQLSTVTNSAIGKCGNSRLSSWDQLIMNMIELKAPSVTKQPLRKLEPGKLSSVHGEDILRLMIQIERGGLTSPGQSGGQSR